MRETGSNGVFSLPFTVATFDVDASRRLRLSALLRWQQEAGERQVQGCGMGWEALAAENVAFVLARSSGVIRRLPLCGERVTLETWSAGVRHAQFHRGYRLCDEAGEPLTECRAVFALVDASTHRLCRPTAEQAARLPEVEREMICPLPQAVAWPAGLVPTVTQTRPVWASEVDFNGHLNNTVYADRLTDTLPPDLQKTTPHAFLLQYAAEAREGDVLISQGAMAEKSWFFRVQNGENTCFFGQFFF